VAGGAFQPPRAPIIDHYIYAICGDGDLMEGITQEAASLAGHLRLGKLIYLYDNNHISLAGATGLIFTEDVAKRFDAYGWHTRPLADGNDTAEVAAAIAEAQAESRPSLILVRTHIGYGSPKKQDSFTSHGAPLGEDELLATKKALGWPTTDKFFIPPEALECFRTAVDRGRRSAARLAEPPRGISQGLSRVRRPQLEMMIAGKLPEDWAAGLPKWQPGDKPSPRAWRAGWL
jgi:transketolase